jgi:hypothetical protein
MGTVRAPVVLAAKLTHGNLLPLGESHIVNIGSRSALAPASGIGGVTRAVGSTGQPLDRSPALDHHVNDQRAA